MFKIVEMHKLAKGVCPSCAVKQQELCTGKHLSLQGRSPIEWNSAVPQSEAKLEQTPVLFLPPWWQIRNNYWIFGPSACLCGFTTLNLISK